MIESTLCPTLYARLERLFGRVTVANPGEAVVARKEYDPLHPDKPRTVVSSGEYLAVNCPFCGDTRRRLWLSYRFTEFPWLCHCFNEGCTSGEAGRARRQQLLGMLSNGAGRVALPHKEGVVVAQDAPLGPVPPPGDTVSLASLPPSHPANDYLIRERHFDPYDLAARFGLAYCSAAPRELRPAEGRIICPVYMGGVVVGWQGRYPADLDWKNAGIPKYWNLPHMPRRRLLYNFDSARHYRTAVLCEGVTDVWRVGPNAMCFFGKSVSSLQRDLLCWYWRGGVLVLLLDADAGDEQQALADDLSARFQGAVLPVAVPAGLDPGKMTTPGVWDLIGRTASAAGVALDLNYYTAV